eukprot:711185-Heterocapsa_arctica.AAC.1
MNLQHRCVRTVVWCLALLGAMPPRSMASGSGEKPSTIDAAWEFVNKPSKKDKRRLARKSTDSEVQKSTYD